MWPFARSHAQEQADALLTAVQGAARQPALYGPGGVPDTLEGRFELMTLYAALALIRLKNETEAGALAQNFTDKLFRLFDAGLREAGVGDLSVPKRMRRLAGDFYGRLGAYSAAVAAADAPGLASALARNTGAGEGFAATLAAETMALAQAQAKAEAGGLFTADGWLAPAA